MIASILNGPATIATETKAPEIAHLWGCLQRLPIPIQHIGGRALS